MTLAPAILGQQTFEDLRNAGPPAYQDWTADVAVGDVDGDGLPDLVVASSPYLSTSSNLRIALQRAGRVFVESTGALPPLPAAISTIALGDVDRDGDLDLVVGFDPAGPWPLWLLLNDGSGGFAPAPPGQFSVPPAAATELLLADLDGDGDHDLLVASDGSGAPAAPALQLFANDSSGTFTDVTATALPTTLGCPRAVEVGDLDGDGDLDLLLANGCRPNEQDRVLRNIGNGTFVDATNGSLPFASFEARGAVLVDVDGDSDLDAVVVNVGSSMLYRNDGTGSFSAELSPTQGVGSSSGGDVDAADIDNDGDMDLVQTGTITQLYENDGSGAFSLIDGALSQSDGQRVRFADCDGDGGKDLLVARRGVDRLLYGDGSGTFEEAGTTLSTWAGTPVLEDVDGDGDLDALLGGLRDDEQPAQLHLNDGTGMFTDVTATHMPSARVSRLATGDFDSDGDLDVFATSFFAANRIYINDGSGRFADESATRLPPDTDPSSSLSIGDVDGDGDLDVVVGNRSRQSVIYRNNGSAVFVRSTVGMAWDTTAVALGDVDRDGDLDLILGFESSGATGASDAVLKNNGAGGFGMAGVLPSRTQTTDLALGDVDADGDLDIVVAQGFSSGFPLGGLPNLLFLNDGQGVFVLSAGLSSTQSATASIALVDLDRDGDLDLACANTRGASLFAPGRDRLYRNDGAGVFTDTTASDLPERWSEGVAAADVDGDGDRDLVLSDGLLRNVIRQLDVPFMLAAGETFRLDGYRRESGAPQSLVISYGSFARASVRVPGLGLIGIDATTPIELPWFFIPQPAGVGSTTVAIPNQPAFAGLPVYFQALITSTMTDAELTNVVARAIR